MRATARAALPTQEQQYLEEPSSMRIGVACSGGGIRSAAFSLGALQALQADNVLPRVEYVAAVSGGNYIASAFAITASRSDSDTFDEYPPWSQGSPEERLLRRHTDYLAPGITGRMWLAVNFVYGFIVNYTPFVLSAFVLGRLGGWLARLALGRQVDEAFWQAPGGRARVMNTILLASGAALIVVALALVLHRRLTDGRNKSSSRSSLVEHAGGWTFGSGLAMLVVVGLTPTLLTGYRGLSRWTLQTVLNVDSAAAETQWVGRFAVAAAWVLLALLVSVAGLALSRRSRSRMLTLLAGVGASGLLVVPFASSFEFSSAHGITSGRDIIGPAVAVTVLALMAVFVHNRRYSMHLFYRERLCSVYAVVRRRNSSHDLVATPLPYGDRILLSDVGAVDHEDRKGVAPHMPKLVICCAVNVTSHDAPIGRFASSFTFEARRSGSPLFGYRATTDYEQDGLVPGTALTLPSIMAVSGAALSPMMGRFTHPALRFLMALTNVRLGVWIPHQPSTVTDPTSSQAGEGPDEAERPSGESPTEPPSLVRRAWNSIAAGWLEPGALYVLREAIGTTGGKNRFIYVSDGGHFENLGLVELIRRRCTHIMCFDASLDTNGEALDIGRAIALARSDLGAEIELDPSSTLSDGTGVSGSMVAVGHVRYPDGQKATLIFTRAALTRTASWDLRSFSKRDRRFPNHSTRQQVFNDEQFQAYRSLGFQGGRESVKRLNLPPVRLAPVSDSAGGVVASRPS
jgi:hypothetical protein